MIKLFKKLNQNEDKYILPLFTGDGSFQNNLYLYVNYTCL